MTTTIFKDDNAGFIAWRDENPDGYVANSGYSNARNDREFYLPHIKLHRSKCTTMAPDKNGEKPWTSTDYFKVCSDSASELENWFLEHADTPSNWSIVHCQVCGG